MLLTATTFSKRRVISAKISSVQISDWNQWQSAWSPVVLFHLVPLVSNSQSLNWIKSQSSHDILVAAFFRGLYKQSKTDKSQQLQTILKTWLNGVYRHIVTFSFLVLDLNEWYKYRSMILSARHQNTGKTKKLYYLWAWLRPLPFLHSSSQQPPSKDTGENICQQFDYCIRRKQK